MGLDQPTEQSELDVLLERARVILDAEKPAIMQKAAQIILEKTGDGPMTAMYRNIKQRPYQAGQKVWDDVITHEQAVQMNTDVIEAERYVRENIAVDPENALFVPVAIELDDEKDIKAGDADVEDVLTLSGCLDKEWAETKGMHPAAELCTKLKIGEDITEREVNILKLDSCIEVVEDLKDDDNWDEEVLKVQTKMAALLVLLEG